MSRNNLDYKYIKSDDPEIIRKKDYINRMLYGDENDREKLCMEDNPFIRRIYELVTLRKKMSGSAELTEEQAQDLFNFFDNICEDHYYNLTTIDDDITSQDELHVRFINDVYDIIPQFLKDRFDNSQEKMIESCRSDDNNFIKYVIWNFQLLTYMVEEEDDETTHNLIIWGTTGSGKTTLIKTLATAFNSINPNSQPIVECKISHHTVGTTEVSKPIPFYLGKLKCKAQDVPGTNDASSIRKDSDIIKGIQSKGERVDSIMFAVDVKDDRPCSKFSDKCTLRNLAYGFKNEGTKIWSKVIVCLTKSNAMNFEKCQKPVFNDDVEKEEFFEEYKEYIAEYGIQFAERIREAKKKFKEQWMDLFELKDLYSETPQEEREKLYKSIHWVVCGNVQRKNESYLKSLQADGESPFNELMYSTVNPIPKFEFDREFKDESPFGEIRRGEYVKHKNWINDLVNAIVSCSDEKFRINCASVNHKYVSERENRSEIRNNNFQGERIDAGFNFDADARKNIGQGVTHVIHNTDTGFSWRKALWVIGGVGGGAAAVASGPIGWYTLGGVGAGALGGEGGFQLNNGVRRLFGF